MENFDMAMDILMGFLYVSALCGAFTLYRYMKLRGL